MYKLFDDQVNAFTSTIEDEALKQIQNLVQYEFVQKPVAIMPDVHAGKGCTIGSVFVTNNVIIPMAVGVDIGCGMTAWQTTFHVDDLDLLSIYQYVNEKTEILNKAHSKLLYNFQIGLTEYDLTDEYSSLTDNDNLNYWTRQLGTLGSGNHFLEVSKDENDLVWIIVHSGSRNLGHTVATCAYNRAKAMNPVDSNIELSYLTGSDLELYYSLMTFCVAFASESRNHMLRSLYDTVKMFSKVKTDFNVIESINTVHNYATRFSDNQYLCRKGACSARNGELVIIPGSMNTNTYICEGLGNADSYSSCPHGAGRRMSRGQAKRVFSESDVTSQLEGLQYCTRSIEIADELPLAYKNIENVLADSKDLVRIIHTLDSVINWKGK